MMEKKHLHIAAGVIRNAEGEIFIAQRPLKSHMGGYWEFPGGKLESGESPEQALVRELEEELGIVAVPGKLLQTAEHEFPDRLITIYFFLVEEWQNAPYGREGQPSRWVKQTALIAEEFPPVNRGIVALLTE
ncbi:8-oxo-dGTP diphosphatase MutT [Morganella morganii]|nr:8-oxo-dGTP diphosphatase MutT [Morganella morganii]PHH08940.1 8-oxo-dGTP diphosphatase MutT [Morganella morganii]